MTTTYNNYCQRFPYLPKLLTFVREMGPVSLPDLLKRIEQEPGLTHLTYSVLYHRLNDIVKSNWNLIEIAGTEGRRVLYQTVDDSVGLDDGQGEVDSDTHSFTGMDPVESVDIDVGETQEPTKPKLALVTDVPTLTPATVSDDAPMLTDSGYVTVAMPTKEQALAAITTPVAVDRYVPHQGRLIQTQVLIKGQSLSASEVQALQTSVEAVKGLQALLPKEGSLRIGLHVKQHDLRFTADEVDLLNADFNQ